MKIVHVIGLALALGAGTIAQAQNDVRKEVNVEVINGEHHMTITTTDQDGNVITEEFVGEEAREKMHSMHQNEPKGAHIERVIIEEIEDADGNVTVIKRKHEGAPDGMRWESKEQLSPEERAELHRKMEEFHKSLTPEERAALHHHMMRKHEAMTPEERKAMHEKMKDMHEEVDVQVDEEKGTITIKMGDQIEVIDMNDMEESGDGTHKMIFITEDEEDNGNGPVMKKQIMVITKNVRIEEDEDLQNDLKGVDFKAYPNPNDGHFNIELKLDGKKDTYFSITDLSGKEYYKGEIKVDQKGMYTQPVRMEDMPKGTYLIQVTQGKKAATKKVVIE